MDLFSSMQTENNTTSQIENCFVCLNDIKNPSHNKRRCTICKCYAHDDCWYEFLDNYNDDKENNYELYIFAVYTFVKCPQCRNEIIIMENGEEYSLSRLLIDNIILYMDDIKRSRIYTEKISIIEDMCKFVYYNKTIILQYVSNSFIEQLKHFMSKTNLEYNLPNITYL